MLPNCYALYMESRGEKRGLILLLLLLRLLPLLLLRLLVRLCQDHCLLLCRLTRRLVPAGSPFDVSDSGNPLRVRVCLYLARMSNTKLPRL